MSRIVVVGELEVLTIGFVCPGRLGIADVHDTRDGIVERTGIVSNERTDIVRSRSEIAPCRETDW